MSEALKSAEVKKEIKKPNGVELPHVQEIKKLDTAAKHIQEVKRKQEVAQWNKLRAWEKEDAGKALLEGFNSEPGKLNVSQKPKENFVESSEVKDARELTMAKNAYQEQLKTTYETHIWELKDKPEEQKKIWQEYLWRCVRDLWINSEKLGRNDVKALASTLPKAWKETLLDAKSTEKNPELKKVREKIFEQVSLNASTISRASCKTDREYELRLRESFRQVTGVDLSPEEFRMVIRTQNTARREQTEIQESKEKPLLRKDGESDQSFEARSSRETPGDYTARTWETVKTNISDEDGKKIWYSEETWKKATESAENAAKTILDAFKKKYSSSQDVSEKPDSGSLFMKLSSKIMRHAQNNPTLSASQPFLLQDLRAQKAYIYYPWGNVVECSATHGSGGVWNTEWSHGTSLWSKKLSPASNGSRNGNSIKIRTDVHGLEPSNQSDFSRMVRIHEQHGARTWGCTGLPLSEMQRFDAAIDAAGGGAMEVFLG